MWGNRSIRTDVNHRNKDCGPWGAVDPLSAYFFMYPYDWKHLLKRNADCVSMMGVLGAEGGLALTLFQGWGEGVKYCWKMCSSNFSFRNKFIAFLSCGLSVDNNTHYKLCEFKSLTGYRWRWLWKPKCLCFTNNKIKDNVELRSLN